MSLSRRVRLHDLGRMRKEVFDASNVPIEAAIFNDPAMAKSRIYPNDADILNITLAIRCRIRQRKAAGARCHHAVPSCLSGRMRNSACVSERRYGLTAMTPGFQRPLH